MLMFHNPFTYKSMTVGRVFYFKRGVLLVKMLNRSFKALAIMVTVTAAEKLTLCAVYLVQLRHFLPLCC